MLKSRVLIPDAPFCSVILSVSFLLNSVLPGLLARLLFLNWFPPPLSGVKHSTMQCAKRCAGVLVSSRHGLSWVCCCDLVLVGCASVQGALDAVLPASPLGRGYNAQHCQVPSCVLFILFLALSRQRPSMAS